MNNNILLVSDDETVQKLILEKLVLLRESDKISCCGFKDVKRNLECNSFCIVIIHSSGNDKSDLKLIKNIKDLNSEIILYVENINSDFILKAYDSGMYDYITPQTESWEILIKVVNCFKMFSVNEASLRDKKFLNLFGLFDMKTGLYKYSYLKDIFEEINDDIRIQTGFLCVVTLADTAKTKISTNRFAGVLKKSLRMGDIAAAARGGLFYIIIPNIDISGIKGLLQKIQSKMGEGFELRAGLCKIGTRAFSFIEKNAKDSLQSAIQDDEMYVCLTDDNNGGQISWLDDDNDVKQIKHYKLFQAAFENKLNNIISPLFLKFQKESEIKLPGTKVSQYTNEVESVFSLKKDSIHSELIIRYNGFAKFKIEIIHSGLNSPENSKFEIPLNKLTEKELIKYLKQLRMEYKQDVEY